MQHAVLMQPDFLAHCCQEAYRDLEKQATAPGHKEKRQAPEGELSAQRPRKLFKEAEESDDGRSDVPTPCSSAGSQDAQEVGEAEDSDLFRGKFARTQAQKKQDNEEEEPQEPEVCETPKVRSGTALGATPSSRSFGGLSDDVRDLLATIEDRLLATIPSSLTRPR